jgi:uncharacterized protein (TIGR03067 family)
MGRTTLVLGALALVLTVAVGAENLKDGKDGSQIVGTWKVTAVEKDGKAEASTDVKVKEVKITRDTIACMDRASKKEMECTYTLDTSSKPWRITMKCTEGEHKGKTMKGIVRLEGDTLKVCHAKPDKDAPTSFRTSADQRCMTLTRERK